jgi:hypothetical protein
MRTTLQEACPLRKLCTYSSSATSSAVPVSSRVAETVTNGDTLVSQVGDGLQHVLGQVVCGLLVNVMLDVKPLSTTLSSRTALSDVTAEPILRALDLVGAVLVVVISVNVEVNDVVTEISHVSLTLASAAGVRWAHVGGDLSDNVAESHLVLPHLLLAVDLGDGTEVQVGPGMRSELVTLLVHALEDIGELGGNVDLALVDVVTSDEECGLCIVLLHQIQDMGGENLLWAVVVGQGHRAGSDTVVDTIASIFD